MRLIAVALLTVLASLTQLAHGASTLLLNVTLDYDQERDHVAIQSAFNDLTRYLSGAVGQPVKLIMTQNAERVGERIRTGTYSIMLAPAQLVGLAMRNGYTPVARTAEDARVVMVASKGSGAGSLETAKGKRIALPHQESLVSYMVRGEMNALGLSPNAYFSQVMHMNKYGAVLYAMDIGQTDVVAVKAALAEDWLKNNPGAKVIKTLPAVPMAGVVVNDKLDDAVKGKIRVAFTKLDKNLAERLKRAQFGDFDPADKADFEFVSTRGFFTPEVMAGATIVKAEEVKKLMSQKVPLFDVRPQAHYREGHIPGAVNVPYKLSSPKEIEYDDSVDTFDVSKLPQDKNAPMIFQCNGAECWYSYKASRYMVKRGYKKVYWFRTGLPAWKAAGYSVERGG